MATIEHYVKNGITTLDELKGALQIAMQLEFSTIPPYLCAQWSVTDENDPVAGFIQDIVVQEMFHFALAGNMLTAIGGLPDIAGPAFVVDYPTNILPGGIKQSLPVDLKPLSKDQLLVFMQIENPESKPVALAAFDQGPATIGDFYDAIADGFTTVNPAIVSSANAVKMSEAVQIKSIGDAQAAISRIKEEGEGTATSPDEPVEDDSVVAHYYRFKEIFVGKQLVQTAGKWDFDGPAIAFPAVTDFAPSPAVPSPSLAFNQAFTQLLVGLQACWTSGAAPGPQVGAMFALESLGTALIRDGIRPEFRWAP